ncbi:ComEC/Rec2 family competence protein, partial [Staphylococcus aureus]
MVPVLQGRMERTFTENKGSKMRKSNQVSMANTIFMSIVQGLTASIGINLILLPVLLYYFFEFPVYSLILNLFVIPLMSVLLF